MNLRGKSFDYKLLDTFEVGTYAARTGRNPQTGETLEIPAGKRPKFTPGTALKKAVNG